MEVLSGKDVSAVVRERLKSEAQGFKEKHGVSPGLAVVLVGSDAASQVYVKNKVKACEKVGFYSERHDCSEDITEEELLDLISSLNENSNIHGILVQLPLPKHLNETRVLERIDPMKDADGFSFENLGLLLAGQKRVAACTPFGVIEILDHYKIPMEGKNAVVVGRSNIVGKPMALLLLERNATVTVCHSRTKDLSAVTREADIVVVAAGKPRFLGKADFKEGATVIDVGIHRLEDGKLCGDVRYEELDGWASAATPVPGGVGPMTIAMLLHNTLKLAKLKPQEH